MPRTVADATRFTPTGPHAFTPHPPPSGSAETPQQRVARLREAARRVREAEAAGTVFDRLLDRGRLWADRAHRITAVGLIGATVVCGAVTVYAVTDMMMYNRRRRAEYAANPPPPSPNPAENSTAAPQETAVLASLATAGAPQAAASLPTIPSAGPWEKLKSWTMSGLTPADVEYKTAFEKAREEELLAAEKAVASIVVEAAKRGDDVGARVDRLGADDLVKGDSVKGGSTGVLSSITGWWSGR